MRRFRVHLGGVFLLAGTAFLTAASSGVNRDTGETGVARVTQSGDERQVAATIEAVFRAAESNDIASLDSLYAGEQLTVIESAGINRGWSDFRDHHLAPELKQIKNFRYRPFEIEPHISGSLAWAIFRYHLKGDLPDRTLDVVGRGTAVLEKKGTRWIVRHTHTASRPRRPTDPPANF